MRARPVMYILAVAAVSLGISGILASFVPLPEPQFHDEFSYLLAADTFAHGRLTNPPHKLWRFFETFQVIQQPTYQSKYQPGQGLVLALGQLLGHPIFGVWLSTAAAVAAAWWALRAFVPARWATIVALIAATHPLLLDWNWSYWGGGVAMIGGGLVVGAFRRLRIRPRVSFGIALGIGISILMLSRPFEGLVLVMLSYSLSLRERVRVRAGGRKDSSNVGGFPARGPSPLPSPARRGGKARARLATLFVLVIALAFQLYYNFGVTRSPFRLPYLVYESTYAVCPPFIWLPRSGHVPDYQNAPMRDYYLSWELPAYERQRTASGLIRAIGEKSWNFLRNYFQSFALAVPIALAPLFWRRDRVLRRATLLGLCFTLVVFGNLWFFPHYAAPACPLYLVLLSRSMRNLNRLAPIVVRIILLVHVATFIYAIAHKARASADGWNYTRAELIAGLKREGGRHLVIVRPGPDRYTHNEWVYNGADIDGSAVVFAHDRGEPENRALLDYFRDRTVWLLEVGVRFEPYRR